MACGLAAAAMAAGGAVVRAQVVDVDGPGVGRAVGYGYPAGYGGYGWNGWGGGATVPGQVARGLGAFAAGVGEGNLRTAQARVIQGTAVANLNEYLYRAQQIRNMRYAQRAAAERAGNNQAREAIEDRILSDPDPRDIRSGAALNRMLDQMADPRFSFTGTSAGTASVPGRLIKTIPFQHQPGAVAVSLAQLTAGDDMPAAFRDGGPLAEQGKALRDAAAELDRQDREGKIDPKAIEGVQNAIDAAWDRLDATYPAGPANANANANPNAQAPRSNLERDRAERYLKAVSGFARMLEAPQMESLLADVEKRDAVTIGSLIDFMTTFNLQFGPAESPEVEAAYAQLYPMLASLHQDVAAGDKPATDGEKAEGRGGVPYDFFGALSEEELRRARRADAESDRGASRRPSSAAAPAAAPAPVAREGRETERMPRPERPRGEAGPGRESSPGTGLPKATDPPVPTLVDPPAFTPSPNNRRATGGVVPPPR
jgi:hypothetical protein